MAAIRRFGVLVPPGNVAVEYELPRYLPVGAQMHTNRLYRRTIEVSFDALSEMLTSAEQATLGLVQIAPEIIAFACTSASFINGPGADVALAERLAGRGGVPVITTSTAVAAAIRHVGARNLFVITPYQQRLNDLEVKFLAGNGFTVTGLSSFHCGDTQQIRDIPSSDVAALVRANAAAAKRADAVLITCTNLHTINQIAGLEQHLGRPVISSNQATLWAVLKRMDISAAAGGGSLLDLPPLSGAEKTT